MYNYVLESNNNYRLKDGLALRNTIAKLKRQRKIRMSVGFLCISITLASAIYAGKHVMQENSEPIIQELEGKPIPLDNQPEIVFLSENDVSNGDNESLLDEEDTIVQYFNYYCDIYQIKADVVYQKAKELTNDFSDSEWVLYNNIPGTRAIKQERNYDSQELGILAFVRHMKQIPETFGFTTEELATNKTYFLDTTYEEFTEKECALFGNVDPILCQAIQYHETKCYTSEVFLNQHNPAGLRDETTGAYWQFRNPAEGILQLLFELEYSYCNKVGFSNLSIEEQIIDMQPRFCPYEDEKDTLHLNQYWISGVTNFYHTLSDQKEASSNVK